MVLVLWVIAMLSTVAMLYGVAVRGRYHAEVYALNDMEDMEAIASLALVVHRQLMFSSLDTAKEGSRHGFQPRTQAFLADRQVGVERPLWTESNEEMKGRIIPDGRVYTVKIEDRQYRLSVEAEQGKVDLNAVQDAFLHQLLRWLQGRNAREGDALADCLLDWRDSDNLVRLSGAEEEAYTRAGLVQVPADGPFASVDEMRLVLGMTPQLYFGPLGQGRGHEGFERWDGGLRDLFTVYNGTADVLLDYAPPPLRAFYEDLAAAGGAEGLAETQRRKSPPFPRPHFAGKSMGQTTGNGESSRVVLLKVNTGHAAYRVWLRVNEGRVSPKILRVEEDMHAMMARHVQK